MNPIQRYFAASVLGASIFVLTGCPPPPPPPNTADTSPPGFTQVVARLEAPAPPNPRGEFDITSADVSKVGIGKDLAIRVIALAGDPESAIKDIAIVSNLTWQCSAGHNKPLIGIVESVPLAFSAFTQPASPVTPLQINVVANPITQTGCDMSSPGKGPINIRGFVRLVATNGKGLSTTSKTFVFDYANVGSP
jgi:hypothetical protein